LEGATFFSPRGIWISRSIIDLLSISMCPRLSRKFEIPPTPPHPHIHGEVETGNKTYVTRIEGANQPVSIANGVVRAPFQITAAVTLGSRSTLATRLKAMMSVHCNTDHKGYGRDLRERPYTYTSLQHIHTPTNTTHIPMVLEPFVGIL
jgi:hypothetical protein